MKTYKEYSPTEFDTKGLNLPDQQDWLVLPVIRTRDSDALEESNFRAVLSIIPEGENTEIHRFNHWACGWFEIIIVKPNTKEHEEAIKIEERLENYPVLDEFLWSELELEYGEGEFENVD